MQNGSENANLSFAELRQRHPIGTQPCSWDDGILSPGQRLAAWVPALSRIGRPIADSVVCVCQVRRYGFRITKTSAVHLANEECSNKCHEAPFSSMLGLNKTAARGVISWLDQVYHAGEFLGTCLCG